MEKIKPLVALYRRELRLLDEIINTRTLVVHVDAFQDTLRMLKESTSFKLKEVIYLPDDLVQMNFIM